MHISSIYIQSSIIDSVGFDGFPITRDEKQSLKIIVVNFPFEKLTTMGNLNLNSTSIAAQRHM